MTSKTKMRILLVQARRANDPLLAHEQGCVQKRLDGFSFDLRTRNAALEIAAPQWLESCDFLVIGGSGEFSAHDPRSEAWVAGIRRLMDAALNQGIPSLGICFGHQVLGMHFGAEVRTGSEGGEAGTVEISLTDAGKSDPLFGSFGPSFCAQTGHSDYVVHVPDGLELLGGNAQLKTQVFRVKGAPFYSTQFHPDLKAEEARHRYELYVQGLQPHLSADAAELARFDPQRDQAAKLLARFVELYGRTSASAE